MRTSVKSRIEIGTIHTIARLRITATVLGPLTVTGTHFCKIIHSSNINYPVGEYRYFTPRMLS